MMLLLHHIKCLRKHRDHNLPSKLDHFNTTSACFHPPPTQWSAFIINETKKKQIHDGSKVQKTQSWNHLITRHQKISVSIVSVKWNEVFQTTQPWDVILKWSHRPFHFSKNNFFRHFFRTSYCLWVRFRSNYFLKCLRIFLKDV